MSCLLSTYCSIATCKGDKLRFHLGSSARCTNSRLSLFQNRAFLAKSRFYDQRGFLVGGQRSSSVRCSAQAVGGKLLSKTEIPAFIPRGDMMEQLMRWATIEANADGVAKFGLPVKIEPFYKDDDLWGLDVFVVKDGKNIAQIGVRYDNDEVDKYEWVGRGEDGFPQPEGKKDTVVGKNFEIW